MICEIVCYMPVSDLENPDAVGLSAQARDKVKSLNANSTNTGSQVSANVGADSQTRWKVIDGRLQFIKERAAMLLKRIHSENISGAAVYGNNIHHAFEKVRHLGPTNFYILDDQIDTTAALDSSKLSALIMAYAYEIYQLGQLRSY